MAALCAAREGRDCSADPGESCLLRPEDFRCWIGGFAYRLWGEVCGDGEACSGGVSTAGDSDGESREFISMFAVDRRRNARAGVDVQGKHGNLSLEE